MNLPPEYLDTVFRIEPANHPIPSAFAIVTAHDPMGKATAPEINAAADRSLSRELFARGLPHFQVTGASPDFAHQETGWGIATTTDEALVLGREFRQLAIWWVENDILYLIDCSDGFRQELGSFAARLR